MTARSEVRGPGIVVGVDGSPSSMAALGWAVQQARLTGEKVLAVMAWQYPAIAGYGFAPIPMIPDADFQQHAEKALAKAISDAGAADVDVSSLAVEGRAAQVLLDAAADADLLVVGSRGHGGFADALLGSVSQHCAHHAACPVVIMRGSRHG